MSRRPDRSTARLWLVHGARVLLLASIVAAIHWQHRWQSAAEATRSLEAVDLGTLRRLFPRAAQLGDPRPSLAARDVLSEQDEALGYVLQTFPESRQIIGFSGPTNVLLGFDLQGEIVGMEILFSGDTREHVAQIQSSERFMEALDGARWEEIGSRRVDAVSGATLTSLAMLEGIARRMGDDPPSLKFPDPPTLEQALRAFPAAARLDALPEGAGLRVLDEQDRVLGKLLRSGPVAENLIGYQGPTDALIALGPDDRVLGLMVGRSYDNEPYVDYVREDTYFLESFNGLTIEQLAELDLVEAQVEGVSGATMTSMAVAESLPLAAQAARRASAQEAGDGESDRPPWSLADLAAMAVIVLGVVIATTRLRGRRAVRIAFRLALIGYLGIVHGALLSQAMFVGWAEHGVPWETAPALTLLTAAALMLPIASGRNVYCTHLCAHGAVQQLLIRVSPWRLRLSRRAVRVLSLLPLLLLVWCLAVALGQWRFSLIDIEPFDAWLYPVAGWATVTVAVVGLTASVFSPMAYCRFGCPTGALLGYTRRHSQSGRWTRRDYAALALTIAAVTWAVV